MLFRTYQGGKVSGLDTVRFPPDFIDAVRREFPKDTWLHKLAERHQPQVVRTLCELARIEKVVLDQQPGPTVLHATPHQDLYDWCMQLVRKHHGLGDEFGWRASS